jgi:hypothetical protein
MRRWIAILLLCMTSVYLGATSVDLCADGAAEDCASICHVLCTDECATVLVPEPPRTPPPVLLVRPLFEARRVVHFASLDVEPEKDPPRA